MRVSGAVLTVLAVLGLAAGVAQAYTVTHSTLGVLFSDDMEGPYFQAEVGSWGTTNDGANLLAFTRMKTGATSGGPAGAVNGSDYLEVSRDLTKAYWQEAIFTQPVSSGTLAIDFQYWISDPWPQPVTLDNRVGLGTGLGGTIASILKNTTSSKWTDWINGDTGATILESQWNRFQMQVDLDADTYQISVNGTPGSLVTGIPDGTIGRIGIGFNDTSKKFYLDAAPGTPSLAGNTLLCSDDTHVEYLLSDPSVANSNFGDADAITVKAWGNGPNRKAYVKWDISSITDWVSTARVQLQNQFDSIIVGGQALDAYLLNDGDAGEGWDETALTWNNAPANDTASGVGFTAAATFLGQIPGVEPIRTGRLLTLSNQALIDAINNDTDGNLTLMFAIVYTGPTGLTFGSKEDANGHPPNWTVPFAGPALVFETIPAPSTWCLLGFGLVTFLAGYWRRSC